MTEPLEPTQMPAPPPTMPAVPVEIQAVDGVLLAAEGWQEIVPGSLEIGEFEFVPGLPTKAEEHAFRFLDQTQGECSGRLSALLAVRVRT